MPVAALRPTVAAQHLGSLHAYETVLVLVLAFGPFLVIAWLVLRERRRSGGAAPRPHEGHESGRDPSAGPD